MKSAAEKNPVRPACRFTRAWSAFSAAASNSLHARSCAACREYFRSVAALDHALRADARRLTPEIPAGLEHRVARAVAASRAESRGAELEPHGWRAFRQAGLALGALACVALIFVVGRSRWSHADDAPSPHDAVAVLDAAESLSGRLWHEVVPSATAAVQDNALQRELDSVVTGARSALDFLALNFLPAAEPATPKTAGTI